MVNAREALGSETVACFGEVYFINAIILTGHDSQTEMKLFTGIIHRTKSKN